MKLRYGEGSIEQRGERWRAKWYGTDGQRHTRTFPSHEAAAAHLLEVSGKKRQRRYTDPSQMTLSQAAEDWLDRGARRWKGGTYATYRQRVDTHIVPAFGRVKVTDLTTHRIQRWVDTLHISPNTVASCMTALSGMLSECVRLGVVETNAAKGVSLPSPPRTERTVWSGDDVRRVLDHVRDRPRLHALYQVALSTGMRPGEIRALRWEDIDFTHASVTVRRTVTKSDGGGYAVREATKSGRQRTIPLLLPCVQALRVWRAQHPQSYVFGTDENALKATTWTTWHQRIIEETGVPSVTLHGMRHGAATQMLERGIHPKIVGDILGHSSIRITMDIYSHTNVDMQRAAMASLADVFGDINVQQHEGEEGVESG